MPSSLDELKKQRELVQQHLSWLDQQITVQSNQPITVEKPDSVAPAKEKLQLATPSPAKAQTTRHPFPEIGANNDLPNGVQPSPVHHDIATAKVACITLFIAAITLFLFLLFGLPYLIDDSDQTPLSEGSVETADE